MMAQPFTGERFAGDGSARLVHRPRRRRSRSTTRPCADARRGGAVHHQAGALHRRRPRRLRPRRGGRPPRPLRLRLLRLLHGRRRPCRHRRRGRAAALRHRRPDPDHRGRRRPGHRLGAAARRPRGGRGRAPAATRACHDQRRSQRSWPADGARAPSARPRNEGVEGRPELLADRVALHQDLVPRAGDDDLRAGAELRRRAARSPRPTRSGRAPPATIRIGMLIDGAKSGVVGLRHRPAGGIEPAEGRRADRRSAAASATISRLRAKRTGSLVSGLPSKGICSIVSAALPGHLEFAEAERGDERRDAAGGRLRGPRRAEADERRQSAPSG